MNKRIDFTNIGGFPFTQDTLKWMQESYRDGLSALAKLAGDKTILTGVEVTGSSVSAGWISYNGEIIPFAAGSVAADVVISETVSQVTFENGDVNHAYYVKTAGCGNPGAFPFSQLKRIDSLGNTWLTGDVKEVDCSAAYIAANFDGTGLGINERKGWAICNGSNGTKNRGGRVSVGYDALTTDPVNNVWDAIYNTIGATGGEKKHSLSVIEMPPHAHTVPAATGSSSTGSGAPTYPPGANTTVSTNSVGGSGGSAAPHENRQPFIVTLFIQKL